MARTDFTPIYARIERHLRDEIASGHLREGDRMPSEPELAREFGTTRATVARALRQLVFEGAVLRRPGSGTFVAPRALSAPIDLTRVRSFEEQITAQGARITYEVLGFEERAPAGGEQGLLRLPAQSQVCALDRLRIVSGKRFSVESRVIPAEIGRNFTPQMLKEQSLHRILDQHFQLEVCRVEGRIRAGLPKEEVARHLDIKPGRPVLIRDYVLFSRTGRPLACGESVYREDFQIDYVVQQSHAG